MDDEFKQKVYTFSTQIIQTILKDFNGKTVGSDEMDLDSMMKEFFGDFKPGKAVKVAKKKDDKPKKQRALSGYTYFGQKQKAIYDEHVAKVLGDGGDKPKFITWAAGEWKKLSDDEKEEWGVKAKAHHEEKCANEGANDDQ